jgi:hypothetical protein
MKFSIRDLLLVTVIVALAVGWWVGEGLRSKVQGPKSGVRSQGVFDLGL